MTAPRVDPYEDPFAQPTGQADQYADPFADPFAPGGEAAESATPEPKPKGGVLARLDRALAGGAIEGVASSVDFLAGAAELGAKAIDYAVGSNLERKVEGARESIREFQQETQEEFGMEGTAGTVARVVGNIGGGIPVYGRVAGLALRQLTKVPGYIGAAARMGASGTFTQRVAANALSGLPIDLVQAATIPESEAAKVALAKQADGQELTEEDEDALDDHAQQQMNVLLLGLGAGGIGGAVIEGAAKHVARTASQIKAGGTPTPDIPTADVADRAVTVQALQLAAETADKAKKARGAASRAWNQGSAEVRRKLLDGLPDDVYELPYAKLSIDLKQVLLESFGGPKIGPNLPSEGVVPPAPDAPVQTPVGDSNSNLNTSPEPAATPRPPDTPPTAPEPVTAQPPAPEPPTTVVTPPDAPQVDEAGARQVINRVDKIKDKIEAELKKGTPNQAKVRAWQNEIADIQRALGKVEGQVEGQKLAAEFLQLNKRKIELEAKLTANTISEAEIEEYNSVITRWFGLRMATSRGEIEEAAVKELTGEGVATGRTVEGGAAPSPVKPATVEELIGPKTVEEPTAIDRQIDAGLAKPAEPVIPEVPRPAPANVPETGPKTKAGAGPKRRVEQTYQDAGLTDAEIARGGDPLALEGYAYVGGKFVPIDVEQMAKVNEMYAAQARLLTKRLQEAKYTADVEFTKADVVSRFLGNDSRGSTKNEVIARLDARLKEVTDEINRFKRQHALWKKANKNAPAKPARDVNEIDDDIERIDDALEAGEINAEEHGTRLAALQAEKQALKGSTSAASQTGPTKKYPKPESAGKSLDQLTPEELVNAKRNIRSRLNLATKGSEEEKILQAEFNRIMEFEAKRDGGHGVNLQMHPTIGGGVAGFMIGFAAPAETEEDRLRNAVMLGAVGVGGGIYMGRRWGPGTRQKPKLAPWEEQVAQKVVSYDDLKKPVTPFMMRLRKMYNFLVRRSGGIESATEALGGKGLPVQRNPGKLAAIFGRWQAQVESFLIDGPSMVDKDGNIKWLQALPAQKIIHGVEGDTDRLGILMASARALEMAALGRSSGIDLTAARMTFLKAPAAFHTAMAQMRQYNHALVEVANDAGLVADISKMADVFYAPFQRIFGEVVGGTGNVRSILQGRAKVQGVPNPIKGQKGGLQHILNPAEATIANTPRILRAAELNKIGLALADLLDAADPRLAKNIGQRLHGSQLRDVPNGAQKAAELRSELQALGTHLSEAEAEKIIATFSNEALSLKDDILRIHRQGRIEQWRLNPEVAKAFRSLNPEELGALVKFIGLPSTMARFGIVNNPLFVLRQAFRDNWQAWLNTQYGFVPFIDQARGWFNIVTRSKAYQEYLAGGGGYGAIAEQRFARGVTALPDVKRAPVKNPLDQAVKEIREMRPLAAYQTLINPVIEAARVGEYLKARGAGASTLEAVFAAKHVTGNFQQIGTGMRAASHWALFLNPAIQSLDQSARSFMRNPLAYMVKGFVGITLPSMYFWAQYQDDEELDELRKTETGRRYWFTRTPSGSIVKIPKPIFDGQIFGSSVETVLDREKAKDPESTRLTMEALRNDMAVNLLPQAGVIPLSLWANKDLGTGAPIIPQRVEGVDPMYQAGPNTSLAARVVGKSIGVAPAQIDYAIKSTFGQLGANSVRILSHAVEYQETGYVPPKEELPFVEEVFARYPSMNVGSLREFYRWAGKVDQVAKTLGHAVKYDAENVESYLNANLAEAGLIDVYKEARDKLGELRSSIEIIRSAPVEDIPPAEKKLYIDEIMRSMIEIAKGVNLAGRDVREVFNNE